MPRAETVRYGGGSSQPRGEPGVWFAGWMLRYAAPARGAVLAGDTCTVRCLAGVWLHLTGRLALALALALQSR